MSIVICAYCDKYIDLDFDEAEYDTEANEHAHWDCLPTEIQERILKEEEEDE